MSFINLGIAFVLLVTLQWIDIANGEPAFELDLDKSCPASTFFDTSGLECSSCGANEVVTADGRGCTCRSGFIQDDSSPPKCVSCLASLEAPSSDAERCLPCSAATEGGLVSISATRIPATLNTTAGDCSCGQPHSALVDRDIVGLPLTEKQCFACPSGTYVDPKQPATCQSCPTPKVYDRTSNKCVCPTGSQGCVNDDQVLTVASQRLGVSLLRGTEVTYYDVETAALLLPSKKIDSLVFQQMLVPSALACLDTGDRKSCNALANLCVLQNYDEESAACDIYNRLLQQRSGTAYHGVDGWSSTLPWLVYDGEPSQWLERKDVVTTVSFSKQPRGAKTTSELIFLLSVFTLEGEWLGFRNMTAQFQPCGGKADEVGNWRTYGTNYVNSCTLPLSSLLQIMEDEAKGAATPLFYDIYLEDGIGRLYPVPIFNRALRKDGRAINVGTTAVEKLDDVLSRRFFFWDDVSGRVTAGAKPQVIRYVNDFHLTVELRDDGNGKIFPPKVTLGYRTVDMTSVSSEVPSKLKFRAEYTSNLDGFNKTFKIIVIIALVIGVITWLFRLFTYQRRRQGVTIDMPFFFRGIVLAPSSLGIPLTVAAMIGAYYWFVFYKLQSSVYVMMPHDGDANFFKLVLVAGCVGQFIYILDMVHSQTSYDIFFIDWERPRTTVSSTGAREYAPVSVWRTLFVANEWNEMQCQRKTSLPFSLVILTFLLWGLNLEGLAIIQPNLDSLDEHFYDEQSLVLRFAISSALLLAIGIVQVMYKLVFHHRFIEHPLVQFVDLLSLANISIIVFEDTYAGYYLHGRSLMTFADTGMLDMSAELRREQDGVVAARGLTSHAERRELMDNQTFEIYITPELRAKVDNKLYRRIDDAMLRARETGRLGVAAQAGLQAPLVPEETTLRAQLEIASLFRKFISQFEVDINQVTERTFFSSLFSVPPDMFQLRQPIFYHDFKHRFSNVLFYGKEVQLLLFNIIIFGIVDCFLKNTGAAVLITYVVEEVIKYLRHQMGENNISKKSLVDGKFLI
eukprot:jgi/Mesvir1/19632/Mv09918-RA.1